MMSVTLPPEYGYVLLAALSTVLLNAWMILKVVQLRKSLKIFYPVMFSEKHPQFNCAQRVHHNTLELLPFFLLTLLMGGVRHPLLSAGAGALWVIGRIIYGMGYYSGKPAKRMPGVAISWGLGQVPLLGLALSTVASFFGWW